jgi:hypothetical protein
MQAEIEHRAQRRSSADFASADFGEAGIIH